MDQTTTLALETIYTILVLAPTITIFIKTRNLYSFSGYKGLNYFSKAFLFLAIGFFFRYLATLLRIFFHDNQLNTITNFGILTTAMEFFLVLPGLLLLYSLIWKKFEKRIYKNRFLGNSETLIYLIAILLALGDYLLQSFLLMYTSQILLFMIASIVSYKKTREKKRPMMQLYFIAMVLFFIAWIINFIAQYTINMLPVLRVYVYLITVTVCFIFLYIIAKLTRDF